MNSSNSNPGDSGIALIVMGVIVIALIITLTTGSCFHWLLIIASIIIGLLAVSAINGG